MLEAAEKRMEAQQNRGVKKDKQFEYELQKKKLEDAQKYEKEEYALKVGFFLDQFMIIVWFFSGNNKQTSERLDSL